MSFQLALPSIPKMFRQIFKYFLHHLFLSLVIFAFGNFPIYGEPESKTEPGRFDARELSFPDEILDLSCDWEFFPYEFLDPKSPDSKAKKSSIFLKAGETWQNVLFQNGEHFPGFGYGTYRLTIILPKINDDSKQFALFLPPFLTAYQIFVNGKEFRQNGKVSNSEEQHSPSFKKAVIALGKQSSEIEILVHVSNFTVRNGGLRGVPKLGELNQIYSWWTRVQIVSYIGASFILFLSLYHYLLFQLKKTERIALRISGLYLGLFILCITTLESRILFNLLPDELCFAVIRLSRLGFVLALYSGGYILFRMPGLPVYGKWLTTLKAYSIGYVILTLILPIYYLGKVSFYMDLSSTLFVLCGIFFVSYSLISQKKENKLFTFSLVFAVLGAIIDLLLLFELMPRFRPLGLFSLNLFIIPQTIGASMHLFSMYRRTESLSKELFKRKEILEKRVKARTFELEKANRWKANFVSLISHDLRSPLNSVQQLLDLILYNFGTTPDEEKLKFLEMSKQGVTQSLRMMEQLLDVSRFDAIGSKLIQTKFSIDELLTEIIANTEPISIIKGIQIKKESHLTRDTFVIADRTLIGEVFKNLIVNAIKFSFPKTEVTIVISIKGKWISIEFRDRGIGMTDDQIQQLIGEDLIKSIPGTSGERGTGLGIKLCYSIMEAHFGKLRIKSVMGVGSSFEVSLAKSNKSVLLVDDSENYRSDLAELLRRNEWIVIEASHGEEALQHLMRITPSLIVVDKNMPVMNGVSFLHEWEGRRYDKNIPVILLSSDAPVSGDDGFLVEEGIEGIVSLYLSKMYRVEDVIHYIESVYQ